MGLFCCFGVGVQTAATKQPLTQKGCCLVSLPSITQSSTSVGFLASSLFLQSLLCVRYFRTSLGVLLCIFASPRRHTAVVGVQTPAIYCFCIKAFFVSVIFTPSLERFYIAASSSSFALHKAVHCHSEAFMPKNLS